MGDDTAGTTRRGRGRRTVLAAVTGWLAVVVVVSAAAMFAIASAGSEVLDPQAQAAPTTGLPTGGDGYPSGAPSGTPAASGSTGASPTAPGSPGTTTAPPGPATVNDVYRVTGGQVGCACTGSTITLNGAWPDDGWTVKSSTSDGGSRLRVEFEADDARTRVEATCVSGAPSVAVEDTSSGGGGGGGSGSGGSGGGGGGGGGGGDDD